MWINTPEWDEARAYWTAFWRGELIDRPATLITAPHPDADRYPIPETDDDRTRWSDPEFLTRVSEASARRVVHLGESLPVARGMMAAWCPAYGSQVTFHPDTVWIPSCIDDWAHTPDWETDWDDDGWRLLKASYARLVESCRGKCFVGLPPLLVPNDLLSMLRGADRFLMDLALEPEPVELALRAMQRNFLRMWEELDALRDREQGYGNWWPVWCPDRLRIVQSDVSCMISSDMYERFILPELHALSEGVDHVFYHLDGPDAIRHLEMICSVPAIHAIQWVPGAGNPGHGLHWMDLYKKVQSLGKAIWAAAPPADLETIVRELDPRKLLLSTSAASVEQAQDIKRKLVEWTAKYWGTR